MAGSSDHAYGRPQIIEDPARVRAILERLVAVQESRLDPPWTLDSQTEKYLSGMMRGIVAFEIPIERLEAKAKLGQNKSAAQAAGAAAALARSDDPMARETAALMRAAQGDDRR